MDAQTEKRGGGARGVIAGALVATLLAAAAGAAMGYVLGPGMFPPSHKKTAVEKEDREKDKNRQEAAGIYGQDSTMVRLKPVMTNLRAPFKSWVRLEGALIVKGEGLDEKGLDEMGALVQQDLLAYLRTLSLKDLEGASNLAFLRDDLTERARIRTGGKAGEFVILSLVVE